MAKVNYNNGRSVGLPKSFFDRIYLAIAFQIRNILGEKILKICIPQEKFDFLVFDSSISVKFLRNLYSQGFMSDFVQVYFYYFIWNMILLRPILDKFFFDKERQRDSMLNSLHNHNRIDLRIITVKATKGTLEKFDFVN